MIPHTQPSHRRKARRPSTGTLLIGLILSVQARAADNRLLDLSLEELLHVEITSAAKKSQTIAETAAAAFVITQDDIRRSGARSIPEVLRLAPGVEVAQIDGNKWAVSVRGFNGRFANKLLVLMDGRALYTPSFGGVFWDVQDTLMQDIERIEIIRGPGGAIWGANAVNGVINIITRSSRDSRGVEVLTDADDNHSRMASLRFGAAPSENWSYRLYSKYNEGGSNEASFGATTDQSDLWRFGARTDFLSASGDTLSLTAEGYQGRSGESLHLPILTPPYSARSAATEQVNGFFSVGRWSRRFEDSSELQAQFSFDDNSRSTPLFAEARDTTALEIQYHFQVLGRHDVVIGSGLRQNRYAFGSTANVSLQPSHPRDTVVNLFGQDEIQIIASRLAVTLGVDLEHNPLSEHDVDVLPSIRLLGSLNEHNHAWVAVTRAISTPTYEQTAASVDNATPIRPPGSAENPFPVPIQTSVIANPLIRSERITAFELGYRSQIGDTFSIDATTFRHNYRSLRGEQAVDLQCQPSGVSVFVDPSCLFGAASLRNIIQFENLLEGHSTGLEIAADWAPVTGMRFIAAYTHLNLKVDSTSADPVSAGVANMVMGQSPKHQILLRSDLALAATVDLYLAARHVSALPEGDIPAYWSADVNLVWHVTPQWEVAAFGHNLLNRTHVEFLSELRDIPLTSIQRSVGLRVRWNY
jgi:iron complex outermembrane recepter protein